MPEMLSSLRFSNQKITIKLIRQKIQIFSLILDQNRVVLHVSENLKIAKSKKQCKKKSLKVAYIIKVRLLLKITQKKLHRLPKNKFHLRDTSLSWLNRVISTLNLRKTLTKGLDIAFSIKKIKNVLNLEEWVLIRVESKTKEKFLTKAFRKLQI